MTGATVPVVAPAPTSPTGGQGPPGEPPGDFGPVLEAEAQRAAAAGDGSKPGSARTARAEGAAPEGDAPGTVSETPEGVAAPTAADATVVAPDPNASPGANPAVSSEMVAAPAAVPDNTASAVTATTADVPRGALETAAVEPAPAALDTIASASLPDADGPLQASPSVPVERGDAVTPAGATGETETTSMPRRGGEGAVVAPATQARAAGHEPVEALPSAPDDRAASPAQPDAARQPSVRPADLPARSMPTAPQPGAAVEPAGANRASATQPAPTATVPAVEAAPAQHTVRAGAPTPAVRPGVAFHELVEAARTTIRVAARDGQTHARITLHPAELGSVEIRLRYHANGVSADVLADSVQAAQTLAQAVPDLRRALEAQGMSVLWLDVRHGGGQEPRPQGERAGRPGRAGVTAVSEDETTIEPSRLPRPGSTLDVLA